jgi:hypothetical protein
VNHRAVAWLAWSLCWLTVVLIVCAVALAIPFDRTEAYRSLFRVGVVSYALVGGLIASRRTHNPVGWFLLGNAGCFALMEVAAEYARYGLLGAQAMAWLRSWL